MKMTTEDIVNEWEKDCDITPDLADQSRKIPHLHHKYFTRLIRVKRAIRSLDDEFETAEFKKRLYYGGQASAEEYKAKPFNLKVMKSEMPLWLKADDDLKKIRRRKETLVEMKEVLEEVVRQINTRNFLIKSILDYRRFEMGDVR